jgi:hypothetical protein
MFMAVDWMRQSRNSFPILQQMKPELLEVVR